MIMTQFVTTALSGELDSYFACNKWHCNPYCVFVKKSDRIHRLCMSTATARRKKIAAQGTSGWYVCHCGVAEYVVPIMVNNVLISAIFATGYVGEISENMCNLISKKVGVTREEFDNIRRLSLNTYNNETIDRLETYLTVAANMIKNIALKTPLVQAISRNDDIDESRRYVLKAIDYIDKNYYKPINVESISKHCHISSSYLQHLFLKYCNEGLSSYLRKKRIDVACELLCSSNRSVREIALDCGFYDTDYFSVIFKKIHGVSPLAYRKRHKITQQK